MDPAESQPLAVCYEDDTVLIIDKPAGLLSQPGRQLRDSVHSRVLEHYPDVSGPVLVHRLDMDTSGLMILARHREAHRHLHRQFERREVRKAYAAVVAGDVEGLGGLIQLPQRLDIGNRPRQMVCRVHGKPAITLWRRRDTHPLGTRLDLFPITGRTHQLRLQLADRRGLGRPIVGDRLYGESKTVPALRLHLHACRLEFTHPGTGEPMRVESPVPF